VRKSVGKTIRPIEFNGVGFDFDAVGFEWPAQVFVLTADHFILVVEQVGLKIVPPQNPPGGKITLPNKFYSPGGNNGP
jgi:hypothetical protein